MLKRIVQAFFIIFGGVVGIFLIPELFVLLNIQDIPLITNAYTSAAIEQLSFSHQYMGYRIRCELGEVDRGFIVKSAGSRFVIWKSWLSFWTYNCLSYRKCYSFRQYTLPHIQHNNSCIFGFLPRLSRLPGGL